MINHLKQNSLKVKIGDQVKQGQELAQCGNSGAGPIPHVHYQLQKGAGRLLPAQFVDYIADGKPVDVGRAQARTVREEQPGSRCDDSSLQPLQLRRRRPASKLGRVTALFSGRARDGSCVRFFCESRKDR